MSLGDLRVLRRGIPVFSASLSSPYRSPSPSPSTTSTSSSLHSITEFIY